MALTLPPPKPILKYLALATGPPVMIPSAVLRNEPGEPNRKLLPMPKIEVLASCSLVRLTSTKRISVCTCTGKVGSSEGGNAVPVKPEAALPLTNSMVWCGSFEQALQTIRLVVPEAIPVSKKALGPLERISAMVGSPTAMREILTGKPIAFWAPWATSSTDGKALKAAQFSPAAKAICRGKLLSSSVQTARL